MTHSTALRAQARFESPLGMLRAAATARGLAGLWFDGQAHHPGELQAPIDPVDRYIAQAFDELTRYFRGELDAGFKVALDPQGTDFQRAVWRELLRIGRGQTRSYTAVAENIGRASAARATGAAVGRNPLSIIVPCHRVVGSNGALTGYAGGLQRKAALLRLEGARLSGLAD